MKRLIFFTVLILVGATLRAQPDPDKRDERIKSYRVAIFTEVLSLTPEEAQTFWPIYNDYQERRDQMQDDMKARKKMDLMSDAEVEEQIKRHFEMRQRDLDLERELYQKLQKVLPLRKIAKIPNAEREFRERLLIKVQEAREKRQERLERRQNGRNK
ncbi:MAG: hypothetical protein IT260_08805 [Saprospiraceae bacterium]|nr:hypothetical protein [Saprospiraceae bacterium]